MTGGPGGPGELLPAVVHTPLGPDATIEQVQGWVEAQMRHDPALDARLRAERGHAYAGLGPVQLNPLALTPQRNGKHARALAFFRAHQVAGHPVTWIGLDEPSPWRARWRYDYELSPIERMLGDLDTLRRAREAAAADPGATFGDPARLVTRR